MHLAIYHPVIPPNTGNIGRLCVGLGASLQIIGPCGFDFGAKARRRAGLDYWDQLEWTLHPDEDAFLAWLGTRRPWLVTKFGSLRFDAPDYADEDVIVLGNENTGLPQAWHERWAANTVHIPVLGPVRSYNQANAAAMVLAQATLRAGGFERGAHRFASR